jgi:hypothetical protein
MYGARSYGVGFADGGTRSYERRARARALVQFIVTNAGANVPLIFYECGGLEQGRGIEIRAPL